MKLVEAAKKYESPKRGLFQKLKDNKNFDDLLECVRLYAKGELDFRNRAEFKRFLDNYFPEIAKVHRTTFNDVLERLTHYVEQKSTTKKS